jgi:pyrroloquinoline-quinone synthase
VTTDVLARIDQIVQERGLLKHPFYQSWNRGELPIESMREYAAQYYNFESAYPTFLSGLHHRCADGEVRQLLLNNLWDEEHGDENHVELWLRFCDALGLDREEVVTGEATGSTRELVGTYHDLTANAGLSAGAAALYAFESQVPEVARVKVAGLRDFYGMDDAASVSFFEVHRTLDLEHSDAERAMVRKLASSADAEESAAGAADIATKALWGFLDGVYG